MAKLIALALAFAAFVAFASAHSTIITTTIEEENPSSRKQCSRQIQGERFNECERYLQEDQSWYEKIIPGQMQSGLQSCCQELQYVDEQCQCEAVKEAFRQAQKMQQQQGQQRESFGSQQIREMKQKAENLPNQCKLQTRQCQVGTISVITTTTITEENPQMCQNIRGRRFNECQSYIQKQISGGKLLMGINRRGQQTQGVEQCCTELQNVEEDCQCEAMQEVYRQTQQMQRQQGGRQTQDLQRIVENLGSQCKLQVQQCRIPSAMF
ncbi:unnamed protein product [Lactuca saligna]|uniref:Bifunctional inhibitor/plant lipid transfer protein/seed storage helical domain-containing protein n=1 Tax=Lactuca saligna TaxID=75948 RepID=A0AA35ZM20_LACSI|nr:unnamed protein product [Lactuca saligna]